MRHTFRALTALTAAALLSCGAAAQSWDSDSRVNVDSQCSEYGHRCVYYDQHGNRLGAVSADPYSGRLSLEDAHGAPTYREDSNRDYESHRAHRPR